MITNQLRELHEQLARPYRPLCASATLPYPTFMRWNGRLMRGEPVLSKPGPKPVGTLDFVGLQARLRGLEHGAHRSQGTTAVYAVHRGTVSRRDFQGLVGQTRREVLRERAADTRHVHWLVPGTVWSIDPTTLQLAGAAGRRKLPILPVLDLASRYKLPPALGERLTGEVVAARLEQLFSQFGAPLVLKRDNGSNLNSEEVNEVLARWLVIPLNSPRHYPPYNGGIERSQRELKTALRPRLLAAGDAPTAWAGLAALTVHDLNHCPRRCLRAQTSCEMFAGAKTNMRCYTCRRRKEIFDHVGELAMRFLFDQSVRSQSYVDAAWRRAVETTLQQLEIITISQTKSVTQFL
jgi:transposase InsO family protein